MQELGLSFTKSGSPGPPGGFGPPGKVIISDSPPTKYPATGESKKEILNQVTFGLIVIMYCCMFTMLMIMVLLNGFLQLKLDHKVRKVSKVKTVKTVKMAERS